MSTPKASEPLIIIKSGTSSNTTKYIGIGYGDLETAEFFMEREQFEESFLVYNGKVYETTREGFRQAWVDALDEEPHGKK